MFSGDTFRYPVSGLCKSFPTTAEARIPIGAVADLPEIHTLAHLGAVSIAMRNEWKSLKSKEGIKCLWILLLNLQPLKLFQLNPYRSPSISSSFFSLIIFNNYCPHISQCFFFFPHLHRCFLSPPRYLRNLVEFLGVSRTEKIWAWLTSSSF